MKRRGARAANELLKLLDDPEGSSIGSPAGDAPSSVPPASEGPASERPPSSRPPASEAPPSATPASRVPIGRFVKRHAKGFAALALCTAVVSPLLYRYASFDPVLFAYRAADAISPFDADTVPLLQGDPNRPSEFLESLSHTDAAVTQQRVEAASRTLASLRARFHPDGTHCTRYYGSDAPPNDSQVADAIVEAGLAGYLQPLVRAAARWETERDDALHAENAAEEVITYLGEQADAWRRLGLWMHRGEVVQRYRQLQEKRRVQAASAGAPLPPALEPAARALWQAHGPLTTAALEVARRKGRIDLKASRLALIAPAMSGDDVKQRLGEPMRAGHRWIYGELNLVVSLDDDGNVVRIARGLGNAADDVMAGDQRVGAERAPIEAALGAPLWRHRSGNGTTLVYDRDGHRLKLDFADDTLASIELWRADMLITPDDADGDESSATADDATAM